MGHLKYLNTECVKLSRLHPLLQSGSDSVSDQDPDETKTYGWYLYCLTKETLQPKSMSFYSRQKYCVIMLKSIDKIYTKYHDLMESQTFCSGVIKYGNN